MRYSKQISTGLIIESQSGEGSTDALLTNASQHHPANDIEVGYCTDAELKVMLDAKDVANDIANPLQKWVRDMQATDSTCPRWFEDYVTENSVALAPGKSKESYDAKVLHRSEKP